MNQYEKQEMEKILQNLDGIQALTNKIIELQDNNKNDINKNARNVIGNITQIKEKITRLINEQRSNKPIELPKDRSLPFFAYGFFKSGELAHHKIEET